ncbi:MAG: hypothetical protein PHO87_05080 [Acholeplasmataceae bacterium]|nr:hypothetical protein [Acholeplasmataceae bacterium]
MKSPSDNPEYTQTGQYREQHEAKEICPHCHEYMYKQSVRVNVKGAYRWWPTSWICMYCGYMKLDETRFHTVKKQLPKRVTNKIADDLNIDPNSETFKEWVKTIDSSIG